MLVCGWSFPRCRPPIPALLLLFLLSPCSPSLSPEASIPLPFWCKTTFGAQSSTAMLRPRHQCPFPASGPAGDAVGEG